MIRAGKPGERIPSWAVWSVWVNANGFVHHGEYVHPKAIFVMTTKKEAIGIARALGGHSSAQEYARIVERSAVINHTLYK